MKVGVVVFSHYLRDGRVRRAAEALAARGDEVRVIALAEEGRPPRETISGVHLERVPLDRLSLTRRQSKARYLFEYGFFLAEATRRLVALHRRGPLDLVHVHNMPDLLVVAALPVKLRGVPVVLDIHDLMPDLYTNKFGGGGSGLVERGLIAQLRASAALADGLITVHEEARALLGRYGIPEQRIAVVVNSSDDAIFQPRESAPEGAEVVLGYHGSISRRHGVDLLLRALAVARERSESKLRLRLVGEGDALQEVEALRRSLGLEEVVDLEPRFLPVEALPAWLEGVQIGLAPYRPSPTTDLMLPCKVFDYANLGVAVIMSELRCPRRYFSDAAVRWVPGDEVEALARAIVDLADDPVGRAAQVARMREESAPLAWPRQREVLLATLDAVASGALRRPALPALLDAALQGVRGLATRPESES